MEWPGLRDDNSIVSPDGASVAQNISYQVEGEARRRPALYARVDDGGWLSTEFQDRLTNTYLVFATTGGALSSLAISDSSIVTLKSGLSTAYRGAFAKSNARLYFVNDFDTMQVIENGNATATNAGIAAPTSGSGTHTIGSPTASGGSTTSGTHLLRYRYYNSKSGYISNPSLQLSLTLTGASTLTFSVGTGTGSENIIRSTDSKVDQVIVEMTPTSDSTFYRASLFNQVLSSTTISMTDTTLILQDAASTYGDYGQEPPPLFSMVTEHRGRLFGWGATTVTLTGVTLTVSSTAVSVTGTTISTNWAARLIQETTGTTTYRITAATGSASLTLSQSYTGTTTTSGTVIVFSSAPDLLNWTRSGFPEAWKPSEWSRRVLQNATDVPAGMISHHDVLFLFGQRTMRVLDYDRDPALGSLVQIPTEMGLWNRRCLISANGRIFGWGRSGAWTIDGLMPTHLSRPIDITAEADYDGSQSEKFHGCYEPKERLLWWFYVATGDTQPKKAICYDYDRQRWTIRTFRQAILASTLAAGGTNNVRALLSDENGYSWYLTRDVFDGVPTALVNSGAAYTGVVTISTTGATTTVLPITQTLPTSPSLKGVVLYNPATSGTSVISSNTASQITLATALASAPTISSELYLGSFEFKVRSNWLDFGSLDSKKRPTYLCIKAVPGTDVGKIIVRVYEDFSTTPMAFSLGTADTIPDGVSFTDGATFATVDMDEGSGDGVAFVPLSSNWKRALQWEVSSIRPDSVLKILEASFYNSTRRNIVVQEGE